MWIPLSIAAVLIAAAIFFTQVKVSSLNLPAMQGIQMKYVWYGAGVLVGIIVLALIGKYVVAGSNMDLTFWLSVLLLLALAVLGAMGKGGSPAKWALGFVGTFVIVQALFGFTFGENANMVAKKLRTDAVTAVLNDGPKSTTSAVQQPAETSRRMQQDDLGREFSLMATDVPSRDIYLPNNRCFRARGVDPQDHAFITEVRHVGSNMWMRWEEYKKLKSAGSLSWYPGWIRFTATGAPTPVFYQFYELRSVNCD